MKAPDEPISWTVSIILLGLLVAMLVVVLVRSETCVDGLAKRMMSEFHVSPSRAHLIAKCHCEMSSASCKFAKEKTRTEPPKPKSTK